MNTTQKLDRLAELKSARTVVDMDKQALIDSVLTPEIKAKLAEIDAEFSDKYKAVDEQYSALESEIKQEVVTGGETVKGSFLMAVWSKGRVSWDTKALDGYIIDHPELQQFRKQGEPSVSIRGI